MSEKTENRKIESEESALLADLYPSLNASEREEAAYFLNRYLALIERIDRRLNG